jgi:hypothetical protein
MPVKFGQAFIQFHGVGPESGINNRLRENISGCVKRRRKSL